MNDVHAALRTMLDSKGQRLPVVGEDAQVERILSMDDAVRGAEPDDSRRLAGPTDGEVLGTVRAIDVHASQGSGRREVA